jgi:hypothetical protein
MNEVSVQISYPCMHASLCLCVWTPAAHCGCTSTHFAGLVHRPNEYFGGAFDAGRKCGDGRYDGADLPAHLV